MQAVCGMKLGSLSFSLSARNICLSCGDMSKYASREGRFLSKIMKSTPKKKKYWSSFDNNSITSPVEFAKPNGGKSSKRVAVLNKLFMKNITDLMATGEVAIDILGKGIEISKVQVTPDFNLVNVHWCAKGTECDEVIENTLQSVAGQLRHELSQLRVMGVVPKIQFVKDKHHLKVAEVERLLRIADFGEDYIPVPGDSNLRSEFRDENSLTKERQEVDSPDAMLNEDKNFDDLDLPIMRMDVLGLDHSNIMDKIKRSLKKAQASHRLEGHQKPEGSVTSNTDAEQSIRYMSPKEHKRELKEFLTHRKVIKDKARKQLRNNLEVFEDEHSYTSSFTHFLDEDDKEEKDYLEEDDFDSRWR